MVDYGFKTFESAKNYVSNPTHYENKKGIGVVYSELAIDKDDFKAMKVFKSDNTITLVLFYKTSTLKDNWLFWIPNEDQLEYIAIFIDLYQKVNNHNLNVTREKALGKEGDVI